jgi:hypothetical protein
MREQEPYSACSDNLSIGHTAALDGALSVAVNTKVEDQVLPQTKWAPPSLHLATPNKTIHAAV